MEKTVFIMTLHSQSNYGQQLQNFGLSEKIRELGFSPCTLRWDFNYFNSKYQAQHENIRKFIKKYIRSTDIVFSKKDLIKTIKSGKGVIIGGDQVFRNWWATNEYQPIFRFYGDFVSGSLNLASYAASFGYDYYRGSQYTIDEAKKLLSRFDGLSVRESSGVDILKNTFGLDGIEVLDPVFFVTPERYGEVINDVAETITQHKDEYIAYMSVSNPVVDENLIKGLKGYRILNANLDENGEYNTVEQWLYNIKNSKFVITDSFHCTAFAIIFKRPFIVVSTKSGGNDRIDNILGHFNLEQCRRQSFEEITSNDLVMDIDWEKVFVITQDKLATSVDFLKNFLNKKPSYKKPYKNWPLDGIRAKFEKAYRLGKKCQEVPKYKFTLKHKILRIIIKLLVDQKRYKKLKRDYTLFFHDSKSPIIQFLGRFYN